MTHESDDSTELHQLNWYLLNFHFMTLDARGRECPVEMKGVPKKHTLPQLKKKRIMIHQHATTTMTTKKTE